MTMDSSADIFSDNEDDLVQGLIEGTLTPDQFEEFQRRIATDDEARSRFLGAARTDFLLGQSFNESDAESSSVVRFPHERVRRRRRLLAVAGIAAVLLVGLFVLQGIHRRADDAATAIADGSAEELPKVEFAPAAVFESEAPLERGDDRIREGDSVAMREGFVSITLKSGGEAVIESPSNFSITGENRMKLDKGAAWFRVPESGKGFAVQLPWIEVVDLGTEFTVAADEEINRVQVNRGEVEVRGAQGTLLAQAQSLVAGETLELNRLGEYSVSSGGLFLSPMGEQESETVFAESLVEVPNKRFSRRQPLVGRWEVEEGQPRVHDGSYRGTSKSNRASVFGHFSRPVKSGENAIVVVSFRSVEPEELFHSKGFAGISLFDGEAECFFFGDRSLDSYSWSLVDYGPDYREGRKDKRPHELRIQGSSEVFTLRYRQSNGELEVYRGWGLQGVPVLKTWITPNLPFDRLRVVNGRGGDFSFDQVEVSLTREAGRE